MGNLYAFTVAKDGEDVLIDGEPQGGWYASDASAKEAARDVSARLRSMGRTLIWIEVWRDECEDPEGEYDSMTQHSIGTVRYRGPIRPGAMSGSAKPATVTRRARRENR